MIIILLLFKTLYLTSLAAAVALPDSSSIFPRAVDTCLASSSSNWPEGPGTLLSPQAPSPDLRQLLSQISASHIERTVRKLASFGTRHTLSTQNSSTHGIGAARNWLATELRSYGGRLNVTVPSYLQEAGIPRVPQDTVISNVLATLPGVSQPERIYVISGHYDSRNSDILDWVGDAPGADDDASGVAVVLELARLMANKRPAATIIFAAVAGEEQGLLGAAFLANTLKASGADVQGMFTNDIVGAPNSDSATDKTSIRLFTQGHPLFASASLQSSYASTGGENDSPARQLGRFVHSVTSHPAAAATAAAGAAVDMSVRIIYRLDRYLRSGDHRPFLAAGYLAAARFTEPNENYAHQHQDVRVENGTQYGDLPEFCDWGYIARVARVNAAAVWSLAFGPGTPKEVVVDTSALGNESTFRWKREEGVQYEIVYRPTTAWQWTHGVKVGEVGEAIVRLSKDNVVFGIRAVSGDGKLASPAVYPLPAA